MFYSPRSVDLILPLVPGCTGHRLISSLQPAASVGRAASVAKGVGSASAYKPTLDVASHSRDADHPPSVTIFTAASPSVKPSDASTSGMTQVDRDVPGELSYYRFLSISPTPRSPLLCT